MNTKFDKYEIAQILREIGFIVELTDSIPMKGIAYRRAASTLESLDEAQLSFQKGDLEVYPGIGPHIASIIVALATKGKDSFYENLKAKIPSSLFDLLLIPGMNAKKVRTLFRSHHISDLETLEILLEKIDKISGFSPSFVKKMRERLKLLKIEGPSLLYPQALTIAEGLVYNLSRSDEVQKIEITGTLRRKLELIHHIDIIAFTESPQTTLKMFSLHRWVKDVLQKDPFCVNVRLKQGITASLHLSSPSQYGLEMLRTTGSQEHIKALENIESKKELSMSSTEENFYRSLGLAYIPPELRENLGEIEAARKNLLPVLIEDKDLQGCFHCHTVDSDGLNTLEEMAERARKLGWHYIGISDHSKSSYQANGMSEERLLKQVESIKSFNKNRSSSFKVFAGLECDILKNGDLDFSDEILKQLDFVIISIHRFFNMEEKTMTSRMIKAIENPYSTMLGHMTGRLLRYRNPYLLDVDKVIDACIANKKIIEINCYPSRLDMDWRYWHRAKDKGLKCSINPDAHSVEELSNCQYGINIARKGWLEKKDVINTLPLKEIESILKR